jgi:hypothetical protein
MATPAVTPDPNVNPFDTPLSSEKQEQQQPAQQAKPTDPNVNPFDEPLDSEKAPSDTGEVDNDVGNKVIVPKEGESFQDTMKRAVEYHKSLTPEQQKAAIGKEAATIPKKTAETLGAAAAIGAGGAAALASPLETHAALSAGFKALMPALTAGVAGIGDWAEAHPVASKVLWEGLKAVMTGTAAGAGAKLAGKIVKAAP